MTNSTLKVLLSLIMVGVFSMQFSFAEGTKVMADPTLPITFEDPTITYTPNGFGDANFNPIPTDIIVNPDKSGINMSDSVWMITKTPGAQVWAGASMAFADTIDLSMGTSITVKVWSPRSGVTIRFKTEDTAGPLDGNGNPTIFAEVDATTSVASGWEMLTFDLATAPTYNAGHSYSNMVLFPDFGQMGGTADEVFYFDDIEQAASQAQLPNLPVDFEDASLSYNPQGFGDVVAAVIANPDMSGDNTSGMVLNVTKPEGAQTWGGSFFDTENAVDLTMGTVFTVKIWSPRAGVPVRFKVEDKANGANASEVDDTTTVAMAWETLTFDISQGATYSSAHSYNRFVVFPDIDSPGPTGGENYYFDDYAQVISQVELPGLPVDFESATISYNPQGFGDVTGAVIANPDMSGENTSATVLNLTKPEGAQTWGGVFFDINAAVDLSAGTVFKVKVWSPRAGVPVRFKAENKADATIFSEVDDTTTVAMAWETLTFDLSLAITYNAAHMYDRLVVFPDVGSMGPVGGENYYFDDYEQEASQVVRPSLPVDFESDMITYNPQGFGDVVAAVIANPDMSGENTSAMVLNLTKPEGAQTWAGSFFDIDAAIDLTAGTEFTIKVWSPRAGVPVRFKVEDRDNGANAAEVDDTTTVAMAWETLTFDISQGATYDAAHTYNRLVVFPDVGSMGPVGGENYYFDDFVQVEIVQPDLVKLPIDFESTTADYAPAGFGDASAAVIDNPDMSGENTSAKVLNITKPTGAQVWAGTSIKLDEIVDLTPGSVFSVKVWSPTANTTFLLKFEDTTSPPDANGNPSIISEVQMNTTTASAWETLSFDLSTFAGYDATHNYDQVVIFPNFNVSPTADEQYYVDDIVNVNAVSIDPDLFDGSKFTVYPNPTAASINIDYFLPLSGDVSFTVMDLMGRKVAQVDGDFKVLGDHSVSIGAETLQNGTYVLVMQLDGETVKHSKVVVNK